MYKTRWEFEKPTGNDSKSCCEDQPRPSRPWRAAIQDALTVWQTGDRRVAVVALGAMLAQAPWTQVDAQSAGVDNAAAGTPMALAEIIVTAEKREQRLNDVPQSVTAVSGEELVERGIYDVRDLVKVVPGLSYVESGRSVPVYSIRGVGFFDTSIGARPTVSVYIDEAPIPFSIESKGASFDLQRVEVLKGPQGTLFGQNATGGAINYIAARPTDTLQAGGTVSFGRFNTADVEAFVSGPLASDFDARLAVRSVASGDYQKSYTSDATLGAQHFSEARLLLDWTPSDRLVVRLNGNGFYDGSDTPAAQFERFIPTTPARAYLIPGMESFPAAPEDPRAADWNSGENYNADDTFYQIALRADYKVTDKLTLTSLTTNSHENINQHVDADGTTFSNFDALVTGDLSTLSQEIRLAGSDGPIDYIIGGLYERDRTHEFDGDNLSYSTTAYALAPPPVPPLDIFQVINRQDFRTKAAFGNLDFRVIPDLTVRAGIRYTAADLDYSACTAAGSQNSAAAFTILTNVVRGKLGLTPDPPVRQGQCGSLDATSNPALVSGPFDQHNISWRTGVDYKLTANTLLYANVSKGYKAGSVQTSTSNSDLQYKPTTQESVLAYETGVKTSLLERRIDLTGAAFYYDYTDKQVLGREIFQPNIFGPLGTLINIPKSRVQGAEVAVTALPLQQMSMTFAATYLDSSVTRSFVNYSILGNLVNYKGDSFPYTPDWQLVGDAEYRFPLADARTAFIGGNVNYRSATTSGFGGEQLLNIPAYALTDLRAGIRGANDRWSAQLYGRNVANRYYFTNIARSQDSLRAYTGMPATFGIQLSARY